MKTDTNYIKQYAKSFFVNQILLAYDNDDKFNSLVMGFDIARKELETMSTSKVRFSPTSYYKNVFGLEGRTYKDLYNDMMNFKNFLEDEELKNLIFNQSRINSFKN